MADTSSKKTEVPNKTEAFLKNHKGKLVGAAVGVGFGAVALPLGLAAIGFGSAGVVAGSVAAGIQSVVYGGMTGGAFAVCQSMGAAGVSVGATAVTAAAGAVIGSGIGSVTDPNLIYIEKVNIHFTQKTMQTSSGIVRLKKLFGGAADKLRYKIGENIHFPKNSELYVKYGLRSLKLVEDYVPGIPSPVRLAIQFVVAHEEKILDWAFHDNQGNIHRCHASENGVRTVSLPEGLVGQSDIEISNIGVLKKEKID